MNLHLLIGMYKPVFQFSVELNVGLTLMDVGYKTLQPAPLLKVLEMLFFSTLFIS
jgi:hypothetical protein